MQNVQVLDFKSKMEAAKFFLKKIGLRGLPKM